MDTQTQFELITTDLEEVLTPTDLQQTIEIGIPLSHYIGFEISGIPHIGAALRSLYHISIFQKANVKCSIFLADWHSWINDKLGGDKMEIQKVGKGYFKECFLAAAKCTKTDAQKISFVMGSELYHEKDEYWETVIDVAKHTSLARMQRSLTIMGRKEGESTDFAKLIYPAMQVADIFFQKITIAHAGMDQRKAHVIARDVAQKLQYHALTHSGKKFSPIALHQHLILGLQKPPIWPIPPEKLQELRSELKMSKSIQGSAIFLHDSPEEIQKKIQQAFCVEKDVSYNPVLDWVKYMVFPFVKEMNIERAKKFGGNVSYASYAALEKDFVEGKLHPMDLKNGVGRALSAILAPARTHLQSPRVQKLKEEFEALKVTR